MAISEGTLQSLRVLRDISAQGVESKEKEKDRSLRMAETRIIADERRLSRMNDRLERLHTERRQRETEFTELTGLQAKLTKVQKETGDTKTDTASFLQKRRMNAVDQQDLISGKIQAAESSLSSLNERLSGYYEGYNVLAGKPYEEFRKAGPDKTIRGRAYATGEELGSIFEAIEAKQGREATDEERAGVLRKLEEMGATTFEQLYKQEALDLQRARLVAKTKGAEADAAQKLFKDRYSQWAESTKLKGEFLGLDMQDITPPVGILTSTENIEELSKHYLDEVGRLAMEGQDKHIWGLFGDTGPKLNKLIDKYRSLVKGDDLKNARDVAAAIAFEMQEVGAIDQMDPKLWGGEDEKAYFRKLLEGLYIIEDYTDNVVGGDPLFLQAVRRGLRYGDVVPGEKTGTEPTVEGGFDFWQTVEDIFNTAIPKESRFDKLMKGDPKSKLKDKKFITKKGMDALDKLNAELNRKQ